MRIETLNQEALIELKPKLRIAAVNTEKSALSFLYIGSNNECIKCLSSYFRFGLIAQSLEEAKNLIVAEDLNAQAIDTIIIDIPLNVKSLKSFKQFTNRTLSPATPYIYNEAQLKGQPLNYYADLVDDVLDIPNWHHDFASKIGFLKNAKLKGTPRQERVDAPFCLYKRTFDIIVSSILLMIALPVMALIALVIRLESKGPVFYNAKRAGRGFKIFPFYKFRTMVVNADKKIEALAHLNQYQQKNGPQFFKLANDPRVTKVGKFLRNTSLDELPQLFNVLKGDMSLVGNRPLPLYEASTLTTNEFVERFMAPAGITGLWQIKKRGKADMSSEERINLDISYARKSNLLYDLWIMANTPKALLQKADV